MASGNNSSFFGYVYAVVSRGEVPALDKLLSDYEVQNGVNFDSHIVVQEKFSVLIYAALFILLIGVILMAPGQKALNRAIKQKSDYV